MTSTAVAEHVARREHVLGRLRELLIDGFEVQRDPDEIDPDTPLFGTGLRLDSIDAVELWVQIDLVFGIPPNEDKVHRLTAMRTLNTLVDLVLAERGDER